MKPKLLIFSNVYPRSLTPNTGFYVRDQVSRLKQFFDIKMIVATPAGPGKTGGQAAVEYIDGIEVIQPYYLSVPKIGVFLSAGCYYRAVAGIVSGLRRDGFVFDMIVSYWTYPEGYAAGKLARKYRVPLIIRPRGSDINLFIYKPGLRFLIRRSLKRADKVIPNAGDVLQKIRSLGIPDKKLSYILNGVNSKEFHLMSKTACRENLGFEHGKKYILFAGNFRPVKGVDFILEAVKKLDREGRSVLHFIFLGNGPQEELIRETAKQLQCIKITIVGDVPHDRLAVWMNAADLLCLPSLNEGCPNVVMEAMACGLPVVASRVGAVPELVNSPELGVVVPPGDVDALTDGIVRGVHAGWRRDKLMDRVKELEWPKVAERLRDEFMELIKTDTGYIREGSRV